jgi:hypothetical protein
MFVRQQMGHRQQQPSPGQLSNSIWPFLIEECQIS